MPRITDDLVIADLRGGLNNTDSELSLADDQCTIAENIDFHRSALGGRRLGTSPISLTGATLATSGAFLFQHFPTKDPGDAELWAVSFSGGAAVINRKTTAWSAITPGVSLAAAAEFRNAIQAVSLHGKLFFSAPLSSVIQRMLVWDGTALRLAGISRVATAPTVANTGAGAYAATIRYYRQRWVRQSGGITVVRGEASDVRTFTPSGAGTAARVTQNTAPGEGETHWELEGSADNVDFYRLSTIAKATTTYDDTADPSSYATAGTLSEDAGDYTPIGDYKYLAVDDDKLIGFGSHQFEARASRLEWSAPSNATGVGNDERVPTDTNNYRDLDAQNGGEATGLAGPLMGYFYAFKQSQIHKIIPRNTLRNAYESVRLTDAMGALPGTAKMGRDEAGRPCIYFTDPSVGPCRISIEGGIERCGGDIEETWKTVNQGASLVCHQVFIPDIHQVWCWIATGASTYPDTKLVAYVRSFRRERDGVRGGWSIHTGSSAAARSSCLFSDNVDANTTRSRKYVPLIGIASATASKLIQMANKAGVTQDDGTGYIAKIRTRPFILGGLLRRFGIRFSSLLGVATGGALVKVSLIRDFGKETVSASDIDLAITGSETVAIAEIDADRLSISESRAVAVEFADPAAGDSTDDWTLEMFVGKPSNEQGV